MSIVNNVCDICGSDRSGYICSCGNMRCSCEQGACETCQEHDEYEEGQYRHEAEEAEREDFESEMDRKYH